MNSANTFRASRKEFLALAAVLIAIGAVIRFIPHPSNFTPLAAIALFSGVYLPKRFSVIVPVAAMAISDIFIGFHNLILFTWGSFALVGLVGLWIRHHRSTATIFGGSLTASLLFFLITNWAVMQFSMMYPHTLGGLMSSYIAGLPFLRNMMVGDLFYTGIFFGLYEAAVYLRSRRVTVPDPTV